MRLIAERQRYDNGILILPGQLFEVEKEQLGLDLLSKGLARLPDPPRVMYETKVVVPLAEVQAQVAASFRDLHLPDPEPAPVATRVDPVLPSPDPPKPRTTDRRKWGRRKRSSAKG